MSVRSCLRMVLVLALAVVGLTAGSIEESRTAVAANAFRNPLNLSADPTMVHYNGNYYLSTTQGDRITIWRSNSLATLINAPAVTVWQDSDPSRNTQMWAPGMYQFNGRWYIYYTASNGVDANHRMHVIESAGSDPMGPYSYKGKLADYGVYAIDGEPMVHNGQLYFTWSSPGRGFSGGPQQIYIATMSNPWTTTGSRVALPVPNGTCSEVREGPTFLYRNGRTFLTYSTCDTGKPDYAIWMISIANGANPMVPGNWAQNGLRFSRNNGAGVYGPGHHFFFKSPDGTEDWIAYHAKNTTAYNYHWRTTRAQRISWNADGTPNLGVPVGLGDSLALPSGDPGPAVRTINDFDIGTGDFQVEYAGAWSSGSGCGVQCYLGNDHWSGTAGHTATFRFTGTQIGLYSVRDTGNGIAAMSIDGGPEQLVDYYGEPRVGQHLNYLSPKLSPGPHTLRVRVTGTKNASSSWTAVSIDRADVWP